MGKLIEKLRELVAFELEDKKIPSISYVLVDREGIVSLEHLSREGRLPEDAVFRVGSCTKMLTALTVMQLAERGLLDLDTEVSQYLPDFRPPNPFSRSGETGVTSRRVLSHTAGLVREPGVGHRT